MPGRPTNYVIFEDADPDEQGSFCDRRSQEHFDNVDAATAMVQANEAEQRGDEVMFMDKSVKGLNDPDRPQDAIGVDDRFNVSMVVQGDNKQDEPSEHRAWGWW